MLDTGNRWILEPFQEQFLRDVFKGHARTPRMREAWLVVPEGNAKTTLLAGLGLYHIEFTGGAYVPVAASSRDQAEMLYRQAEGFVLRAVDEGAIPKDRFRCLDGFRRVRCDQTGSRLQIQAADDRTGDGIIPSLCLVDELHRHRDLRLYRTWRGKLEKRDGQIIAISTAGEPGSEFERARELIRQSAPDISRRGSRIRAVSPSIVLHDWAVPDDGDVENMRVVKRANPLRAITIEMLAEKRASPTMTLQHWRRFVCDLPTRAVSAAIQESEWAAARTDERIPEGEPIWLGLDVAWKWDTTAMVPLAYRDAEHRLLGPATILVPPRDGTSLDPGEVETALLDIHARNPVHTVVMDPSKGEQLARWIELELGARVVERGQSNALAALDYERFMEALRNGWLRHAGDDGLTQHALNAAARSLRFGDTRFDRPHDSRRAPGQQDVRVIDALVAAAMVNTVAAENAAASTAVAAVAIDPLGEMANAVCPECRSPDVRLIKRRTVHRCPECSHSWPAEPKGEE